MPAVELPEVTDVTCFLMKSCDQLKKISVLLQPTREDLES